MNPLSSAPQAISSGLTWSKTPHTRNYEFKCKGEVVGTLAKPSIWSSRYDAETRDGRWLFRRGGCLGTGAEIVDSLSGQTVARLKSSWGSGGSLIFTDGKTYRFERDGFWRPVWSIATENGRVVARMHVREKTVEVLPDAPGDRLALLVVFAWYRKLQADEDAASVAVMAAS